MKITVDTNVLISATFWTGASDKIISKVEAKLIQLVLSKEIIKEYAGVLDYEEIKTKIRNKNLVMKHTVSKIISLSTIIEPTEKFFAVKDDPDNNKILECAVAGRVDFIVSNDKHLLKLQKFENISIVSPDDFVKKLC
ncbi:MAG TPA: putative toxin-antitoxin system toxin component, PIN family [Candidatus Nanoarchaeia archaeon]|nr:putative toxin-antitoxin system toxin component, PIN family [Candidatus Nanoarchaeia archaeon]